MRRPICFIGLAFAITIVIYMYIVPLPEPSFEGLEGSMAVLTGRVDKKEYRISYGKEILIIYLKEVQILNPQSTKSKLNLDLTSDLSEIKGVLCYMEDTSEPKLGSLVKVQGKFKEFAKATNYGEFDARSYYEILGMQITLQSSVIMAESAKYDKFSEKLWELKRYLISLSEICFGEDAHIMKAMLLGEKNGLDEDTKQLYQLNGVIHILSISGLHISIIGMGLYKLLNKLKCPKIAGVIISICFMYCYGVMCGMSVSALRAIVMFGFNISAGLFGRTYDMLTAMAIAGISIIAAQPLYLYHSGFLFSFGAIIAIGLFYPEVEENLLGETKLEKIISTSLSISVVTLPVYLCFYFEYPLYSIFLNLIIIPGTTVIVADGLLCLMAAAFYLPLGKYLAFPVHLMFRFYELCCNAALHLPESRSILGKPEHWQVIIFILIISTVILISKKMTKLQFWQCILAAILCITIRFQNGLTITALDVGQGDGIFISAANSGCYLIDGGSSSKKNVGTYQILPFLKAKGINKLDAIFVTHMDSDHYNGIQALIDDMAQSGIKIKNLIMPELGEKSRDDVYHELVSLAQKTGIKVVYINRGETLRHGKLKFTCLHPEEGEESEDTNAMSTVLYLEYEAFSALFTGDLEKEGEKAVTEYISENIEEGGEGYLTENGIKYNDMKDIRDINNITLLKVAHHGSKNSTAQDFVELVSPRIALISAGRDNSYGHPHTETLERLENVGSRIYRTDEGGAITVTYRDGRVSVECFLNDGD